MTKAVIKSKTKKAVGRPSEYHEELIAEAVELIHAGHTDFEIAQHFGIDKTTLYRWKLAHPAFRSAFTQAKVIQSERVEATMLERALGYSFKSEKILQHEGQVIRVPVVEHVPPEVKAMALWLTNRSPDRWKDRQDVNVTGAIAVGSVQLNRDAALALIQVLRETGGEDTIETIEHEPAMVQAEASAGRRFG